MEELSICVITVSSLAYDKVNDMDDDNFSWSSMQMVKATFRKHAIDHETSARKWDMNPEQGTKTVMAQHKRKYI